MPRFGALGKFFGKTVSEGAAFAAGVAVAPALEPVVQDVKNKAWSEHASKPLEAGDVAGIVAEDVELQAWGIGEATLTGIDSARFVALLGEALNAPGLGELMQMWRRGLIDDAGFTHGLRKMKLETRWDKPLMALRGARYTPAEIALGVVRSVIGDPGWLVETLDTSDSNVKQYKPVAVDAVAEAAVSGFDSERMRGLVGSIGLPMASITAAQAFYRGILTKGAYHQAILEGDTRPEWADAILEQARQIASASDYVNARLRGWIDDAAMYAGTARHGMSAEDTQILYLIHGRPAAPGQMATASFRGINGPDGVPMDRAQFLKGIAESDIRPEWGDMLWESRYHYPPLFQLSRLVQAGAVTPDVAVSWSEKEGYAPEVVDALRAYWAKPGTGSTKEATAADLLALWDGGHADTSATLAALEQLGYSAPEAQRKLDTVKARRVASARTTAISDLHAAFKKGDITGEQALTGLLQLGIPEADADRIAVYWAIPLSVAG